MKCTVCGNEINGNSKFCSNCGTKTIFNDNNDKEKNSNENKQVLCPKCNSSSVKCINESNINIIKYWLFIAAIVILGVKVHAWILNLSIIGGAIITIIFLISDRDEKKKHGHQSKMKCNKCGNTFFIS